MSGFRRSVMGIAGALQIILVIASTISGGMSGYSYGSTMRAPGMAELGFVIGAVFGFMSAITFAAIYFAILEFVENTRQLVALTNRQHQTNAAQLKPQMQSASRTQARPAAVAMPGETSLASSQAAIDIPATTADEVIERARKAGWTVTKSSDRTTFVRDEFARYFYADAEILSAAKHFT